MDWARVREWIHRLSFAEAEEEVREEETMEEVEEEEDDAYVEGSEGE